MRICVAVVLECVGDIQAGGAGPAETVDKYVALITLVLGKRAAGLKSQS